MVINQKDMVYGYDPRTGKRLWSCVGIQDYVVPVPIAHDGVVYCLGGRSNRCLSIRLGGRGDVTESHIVWDQTRGVPAFAAVREEGPSGGVAAQSRDLHRPHDPVG